MCQISGSRCLFNFSALPGGLSCHRQQHHINSVHVLIADVTTAVKLSCLSFIQFYFSSTASPALHVLLNTMNNWCSNHFPLPPSSPLSTSARTQLLRISSTRIFGISRGALDKSYNMRTHESCICDLAWGGGTLRAGELDLGVVRKRVELE